MCRLVLIVCVCLAAGAAQAAGPEDSAVRVFATVRYPNPFRPWANGRAEEVTASGTVIDGNRVLTNAHAVLFATDVQVQGRPGDKKYDARVDSLAPDMDLAVLSVNDPAFFAGHPPLPRAATLPKVQAPVTVYGFPIGGTDLAVTKGEVSRVEVGPYFGAARGLTIQVSAAVNPGNSGGPAVVDGKLVGVVFSRLAAAENTGYLIPNPEIDEFLADVKDGRYDGKPGDRSGTRFQRVESETLRGFLRLGPDAHGVMVRPPRVPPPGYPFRDLDVLTKVGDHPVDGEGMVRLPDGLRVPFYYLYPRLARGGAVPVTVVRGGRAATVSVPVEADTNRLIRGYDGDRPPYFIHGPLVFSPARSEAVVAYNQVNPMLQLTNSPLVTRLADRTAFPGEELVVVTAPLFAHKVSRGYGDPVGQVVRDVNGVPVRNFRHLVELLRDATGEHLVIRFAEDGTDLLALRRADLEAATAEVMEDNGIARRGSEDAMAVWKKGPAAGR